MFYIFIYIEDYVLYIVINCVDKKNVLICSMY